MQKKCSSVPAIYLTGALTFMALAVLFTLTGGLKHLSAEPGAVVPQATGSYLNAGLYGGRVEKFVIEPISGMLFAETSSASGANLWTSQAGADRWQSAAFGQELIGLSKLGTGTVAVLASSGGSQLGLGTAGGTVWVTRTLSIGPRKPWGVGQNAIYLSKQLSLGSNDLLLLRSLDGFQSWITMTLPFSVTQPGGFPNLVTDPFEPEYRLR